MSIFVQQPKNYLYKYFCKHNKNVCSRCIIMLKDNDSCKLCNNSDNSDEDNSHSFQDDNCTVFHGSSECSRCYFNEDRYDKPRIVYKILKQSLLSDSEIEFLIAYDRFIKINTVNKYIEKIINKLLINTLKNQKYEKAKFLIKQGADINYEFNPNITLTVYLKYTNLSFLHNNNYNFLAENTYRSNSLDSVICEFVSTKENDYNTYINHIKNVLVYIEWKYFDIRIISGCEYGDKSYSGINNHRWRRNRINILIALGMPFNLNECYNARNHPSCKKCRILKTTRLGYYLTWYKHLKEIKE